MSEERPLEEKLRAWLAEQGYPLEMKVAKAFQDAGFIVTQSSYYSDPETATQREIDVVAESGGEWVDYFLLDVQFAISCKNTVKRPWIVFSAESKYNSPILQNAFVASTVGSFFQKSFVALRALSFT